MNNYSMLKKGADIQSINTVHYFGGKQKEFGRIISGLKIEIEKLKTIRSRYFSNSDQGLIACSHQ